jgi:hypothetical protein
MIGARIKKAHENFNEKKRGSSDKARNMKRWERGAPLPSRPSCHKDLSVMREDPADEDGFEDLLSERHMSWMPRALAKVYSVQVPQPLVRRAAFKQSLRSIFNRLLRRHFSRDEPQTVQHSYQRSASF